MSCHTPVGTVSSHMVSPRRHCYSLCSSHLSSKARQLFTLHKPKQTTPSHPSRVSPHASRTRGGTSVEASSPPIQPLKNMELGHAKKELPNIRAWLSEFSARMPQENSRQSWEDLSRNRTGKGFSHRSKSRKDLFGG